MEPRLQRQRANTAILATACIALAFLTASCGAGGSTADPGPTGNGPVASLSAASLSFGSQTVDATSAAQTVTLSNTGNATLSITSIAVTGTNAGDFAQTNTCGSSVAPGAKCAIAVIFTPSALGTRTAALSISDNASGSPQTVGLSGTGSNSPAPGVTLSTGTLAFSNQAVGTTSTAQAVTLTNSGNATLTITSIAVTGTNASDFTQTNTCGSSVAAGANCRISVTFTPAATGTRSASLTITDNAANSPQTVGLTGTGPTYYVDNCVVVGSDSNKGTSPSAPWLTINKVNTSTFNPGDSILFESTCTWREQLTVPSSGSAGSPITFGAYGTGAQPIISGANIFSSWITEGSIYYSAASVQPNQVFTDGVRLTAIAAKASLATGHWWWDSTNIRIYVYDNPSGHTMEASQRNYAFDTGSQSYLTVQNLHLTESNSFALHAWGTSNGMTISNNTVDRAYYAGITTYSASGYPYTAEISYNTISLCGGSGMEVEPYPSGLTIEHNAIFSNNSLYNGTDEYLSWLAGIRVILDVGGGGGVVVQYNTIYSNGQVGTSDQSVGNGIWFDTVHDTNTIARYNLVYGNLGSGIMIENGNGNQVYGNVSYSNGLAGIYLSNSDGTTASNTANQVYNNTFYGNSSGGHAGLMLVGMDPLTASTCTNNLVRNNISTGSTGQNLAASRGCENDGTYGSGNVYTYNDFGPAASNFIEWGTGGLEPIYEYSTYASWETASGNCGTTGCSHSVQADPQFVNASAAQFWLQPTSPVIDAGAKLGSPYNIGLLPGSSWPNSVLTGDQNSYGSGWEVGAYIFTGQTVQGVLSGGAKLGGSATIK